MGRIATVHSPAQERGIVQGIKRSISFKRAFSLLLAVVLGIMSVGIGGEVAIARPKRAAAPPAGGLHAGERHRGDGGPGVSGGAQARHRIVGADGGQDQRPRRR